MTMDKALHWRDLPAPVLSLLREGMVIPAHPLALGPDRKFDKQSQYHYSSLVHLWSEWYAQYLEVDYPILMGTCWNHLRSYGFNRHDLFIVARSSLLFLTINNNLDFSTVRFEE